MNEGHEFRTSGVRSLWALFQEHQCQSSMATISVGRQAITFPLDCQELTPLCTSP